MLMMMDVGRCILLSFALWLQSNCYDGDGNNNGGRGGDDDGDGSDSDDDGNGVIGTGDMT